MKALLRGAFIFLAAIAAAACYPTSEHPIGTTVPAAVDARLLGAWKRVPKETGQDSNYLFFLQRDDGALEALMVGAPETDDGGWMLFSVKTARLKGKDFLSARVLLDDGKPPEDDQAWTPVYYVLEGADTLRLSALGEKEIAAAIAKGEIDAQVTKLTYSDEIKLTSAGKALDAFFAARDPKALFTEELGTYRQIK
jgi:hypothetical protein